MPTLDEILKAAGVKDEVISGLSPDVKKAIDGFATEANTKLTSALAAEQQAAELRRQAELEKGEIQEYVNKYGETLVRTSSLEAENAAYKAAFDKLKGEGFNVELPAASAAKPAVPGSPAVGGNVDFDPQKFRGEVGSVMSQWFDANNEHIRLFGTPIPDSSESLASEAARARKPLGQFIAERYKFDAKKQELSAAEAKKREDAIREETRKTVEREYAEKYGSNPNLRPGAPSRNPAVPKIDHKKFEEANTFVPQTTRSKRLLDNIHADLQAARS